MRRLSSPVPVTAPDALQLMGFPLYCPVSGLPGVEQIVGYRWQLPVVSSHCLSPHFSPLPPSSHYLQALHAAPVAALGTM